MSRSPSRAAWMVLALVVIGGGLRLFNLGWGVPLRADTGYYHPDERKIVQGAVDFPGDIVAREDLRYPTGFHYFVGLTSWPVRWWLARHPGPDAFLATFLIARLWTVLLGTLAVAAAYLLGRRLYDDVAGLVAAGLLAVLALPVIHGAWATLDVATAFLALVALWRCDVLAEAASTRASVLAGVASGLLIGTKYPGAVILVPGLLAHVIGYRRAAPEAGWARAALQPRMGAYLLATLVVVLLTTPTLLVRPEALIAAVRYESARQGLGFLARVQRDALQDAWGGLATGLGLAAAAYLAAGTVWGVVRHRAAELLLLSFVVPYYLVLGDRVGGRYLIILLPAYALLAGGMTSEAFRRAPALGRAAVAAAAMALWAGAALFMVSALRVMHQPDARTLAARYLAVHAAAGATVCSAQPSEDSAPSWKEPRLPAGSERVDCLSRPDWVAIIGGGEGRFARALASPALGADYSWDPAQSDWWPHGVPSPDELRFYDDLLPEPDGNALYVPAAEFANVESSLAPYFVSVVRVYRRRDAPDEADAR